MSFDLLKTIPQFIAPKQSLTVFAGWMANVKNTHIKNYLIQRFIRNYQVNMSEALVEDPKAYSCFNDFFIRHLKPECRPLAQADITSPVDGCVSEIGRIEQGQILQAKGRTYSVKELLACDDDQAHDFIDGQFATLYLSPKDYHRVHMPIDAHLVAMTYIPGRLFSVQPTTARVIPQLFSKNERLVVFFDTKTGPMVMVLVGATIVGAIGTTWHGELKRSKTPVSIHYPQIPLMQGDEMGYFKLGSTVIMLFADSEKLRWNDDSKAGCTVRYGEAMGSCK